MPLSRPLVGFDCAQPVAGATLARVKASGAGWCARYISPLLALAKDLQPQEVAALCALDSDFLLVTVWETSAQRALGGYDAGALDGYNASLCATKLKMPAQSGLYFAYDFDPTPEEIVGPCTQYAQGLADELSFEARLGAYGSGSLCDTLFDANLIKLRWLAGAKGFRGTSESILMGRYELLQSVGDAHGLALGIRIDSDEAREGCDFGGWRPTA